MGNPAVGGAKSGNFLSGGALSRYAAWGGQMMEPILVFDTARFPFVLFSAAHLIPLAMIAGLALWMTAYAETLRRGQVNRRVRWAAAGLLLAQECAYQGWSVWNGSWNAGYSLPLHICGMSALLAAVMLVTKSRGIYDIVYFWGMAGASQALLTPDIGLFSFPHFMYYKFFVAHGLIVLSALYMTLVERFRPSLRSMIRTVAVTNGYAVFIGGVNLVTGGNYMYLSGKPSGHSLLDLLGPWPWYLVSLEGVMVTVCLICWLPFAGKVHSSAGG